MATAKIRIVCPECGSDNIVKDASARWNVETGAWELSTTYDATTCDDCGHESDDHFDHIQVVTLQPWPSHWDNMIWVRQYGAVADLDGAEKEMPLTRFFWWNEDGIDDTERAKVRASLIDTGTYLGGGGGFAEWRLWAVPAPKDEAK